MAAAGAEVVTTVVDFSWVECRKERLKQQRERCGSIGGVARLCCALVCLCMRGVCVLLLWLTRDLQLRCVRGLASEVCVYVCKRVWGGGEGVEYSINSQMACVCILFA